MSNLLVQNIKHTNGTTAQTIDSSGNTTVSQNLTVSGSQILTPARPSFFVYNLDTNASGGNANLTGGTIDHNIGSHYNSTTGAFTAPVAGVYIFFTMIQSYNSGNSSNEYNALIFRKNGSDYGPESYQGFDSGVGSNHSQANMTVLFNLNASDYVQSNHRFGARDNIQNYFGGYLVG